jgi:hypothetical protein
MAVSRVANSDTFQVTTPSDCEIVLTRLFDAPRQLVFDAMTAHSTHCDQLVRRIVISQSTSS